MVNEGHPSVELKEYLSMEINFLMADMRFKHETKLEVLDDGRSYYVKVNYNALSYVITRIINIILDSTAKGRTLNIALQNGLIRLTCPEMNVDEELKKAIDSACQPLESSAEIFIDTNNGFEVSIGLRDI